MVSLTKTYEYSVAGYGAFPLDMLRYDACYPATSEDAVEIGGSMYSRASQRLRTVRVRSVVKPATAERWQSFGWKVVK